MNAKNKETNSYAEKLQTAHTLAELFGLVKEVARQTSGLRLSGLMLGLSDLDHSAQGFIGAYRPADSNLIVVKERAADLIRQK